MRENEKKSKISCVIKWLCRKIVEEKNKVKNKRMCKRKIWRCEKGKEKKTMTEYNSILEYKLAYSPAH